MSMHNWAKKLTSITGKRLTVCADCGVVLRTDKANKLKECKGRVGVSLRDKPTESSNNAQ